MLNFKTIVDNLDDIIAVLDSNKNVIYCNSSIDLNRLLTSGDKFKLNDRIYNRVIKSIKLDEQKASLIIFQDITNRLEKSSSEIDVTTTLLTKNAMLTKISGLDTNLGSEGIVVFADIDYFKKINDTIGHVNADNILKAIGTIIRNNIRSTDYAGRFGGEEFLIILPNCQTDDGYKVVTNLKSKLEKARYRGINLKNEPYEIQVSLSYGIASYNEETTISEAISHSDKALYESKNNGRNMITIYDRTSQKRLK